MGEDLGDGLGLGEERDKREWRLAGTTDQREDFIDPSEKSRPPGGSGRGGIGCFRCWRLGVGGGRRNLGVRRGETIEAGDLSGEGVVLVGPGCDQRPQGSVGGEDAVVSVAMDVGWGEDLGEPVQKFESGEAESGAARGAGLGEQVENLVGSAADEVETIESEGRPCTVPEEALEALPVGSLDGDAPIEAETAAVLPAEHILGVVGLQEAVAKKVESGGSAKSRSDGGS